MNKKFILRLLMLCLVLTFTTTYMVSGTFAKYTTSITGSDSARVAKFAVKAANFTENNEAVFDLFNTINDTGDAAAEMDVDVNGTGAETVIAPGTAGSFALKLENDSEVSVTYAIDFTTSLASVPLQFSTDGGTTWLTDLADIAAAEATTIAKDGADVTITVKWEWPFTAKVPNTDSADTDLGLVGTAAPSVEAKVTFTQVD